MTKNRRILPSLLAAAAVVSAILPGLGTDAGEPPSIPKVWDEKALASLDVPLASPEASPIVHLSAEEYYAIPVMKIYKSYPVYHPDKEPPGYFDNLKTLEPEIVFDESKLETDDDWAKAGKEVFHAPTQYDRLAPRRSLQDPQWYEKLDMPVAADGTVPFVRYFVREKGKVEVGEVSCATCHIRVMPDGSTIEGAQGNFPMSRMIGTLIQQFAPRAPAAAVERSRASDRNQFAVPWARPDPMARIDEMSLAEIGKAYASVPPGVVPRAGSNLFYPPQTPDLIGVRDRHYLDRTGDKRHRDIGDLMRFSVFVQGFGMFTSFGELGPILPRSEAAKRERFSDAQLYALARYIYSLDPPENPNPFDELAARGKEVFAREECDRCHRPPLYTSNKLVPAPGFDPPEDHPDKEAILDFSVGTDPTLAMATRRGTGFYKVPSLKGVWYRGPLEHNGSVATLEDWFDPRRLGDDYVPTGLRGFGMETRAVRGHKFGLDLSAEDRRALIAFLRTL